MPDFETRDAILAEACQIADGQVGGTLATTHAEDGTPYVTFVLFHLRPDGRVLFGSGHNAQHTRNMHATPEVSFLIDNREVISADWSLFHRIVIEGEATSVAPESPAFQAYLDELRRKNGMAAYFAGQGSLFTIVPRRLILVRGFEPGRHVIDFGSED